MSRFWTSWTVLYEMEIDEATEIEREGERREEVRWGRIVRTGDNAGEAGPRSDNDLPLRISIRKGSSAA